MAVAPSTRRSGSAYTVDVDASVSRELCRPHLREPVDLASTFVTRVGPFGAEKNYDGRHLYLSWYDAGLLAREGQRRELRRRNP